MGHLLQYKTRNYTFLSNPLFINEEERWERAGDDGERKGWWRQEIMGVVKERTRNRNDKWGLRAHSSSSSDALLHTHYCHTAEDNASYENCSFSLQQKQQIYLNMKCPEVASSVNCFTSVLHQYNNPLIFIILLFCLFYKSKFNDILFCVYAVKWLCHLCLLGHSSVFLT